MDNTRTILKRRFSLGSSGYVSPPPAATRRKLILSLEIGLDNDEIELSVLSDDLTPPPIPMPPPLPPQNFLMPRPAVFPKRDNNNREGFNINKPDANMARFIMPCFFCMTKRPCQRHPAGDGPNTMQPVPQQSQMQSPTQQVTTAQTQTQTQTQQPQQPAASNGVATNVADVPAHEADFAAGLRSTPLKRRTSSDTEDGQSYGETTLDWTCSSHDDDSRDWTVTSGELTYNGDTRIFEE